MIGSMCMQTDLLEMLKLQIPKNKKSSYFSLGRSIKFNDVNVTAAYMYQYEA